MGNQQTQECNLLKLEFMTQKEQNQKQEALQNFKDMEEQKEGDEEFVVMKNPEDLYKVSFRTTVLIPKTKVMTTFQEMKEFFTFSGKKYSKAVFKDEYQDLADFYYQNVHSYKLYYDGKLIDDKKPIDLIVCNYKIPLFEIVYKKRAKFDQFMRKAAIGSRKIMHKIRDFFKFKWLSEIWNGYTMGWIFAMKEIFGDDIKEMTLYSMIPCYPIWKRLPMLLRAAQQTKMYKDQKKAMEDTFDNAKQYMGYQQQQQQQKK